MVGKIVSLPTIETCADDAVIKGCIQKKNLMTDASNRYIIAAFTFILDPLDEGMRKYRISKSKNVLWIQLWITIRTSETIGY